MRRRSGTSRRRSGGGGRYILIMLLGILIGLLLAVLIIWGPPYQHELATLGPSSHAAVFAGQQPSPAAARVVSKPVSAPPAQFDFYTVLPNGVSAPAPTNRPNPTQASSSAKLESPASVSEESPSEQPLRAPESPAQAASKAPAASRQAVAEWVEQPAVQPSAPAIESSKTIVEKPVPRAYLLQIGAYKNFADADRVKAVLTMMGFDVSLQSYQVAAQTYHRVVVGPFGSKQEALSAQSQLSHEHVNSVLAFVGG